MAARRIGARKLIEEWINTAPGWKVGRVFGFVVVWLIPVQLFVLLGWRPPILTSDCGSAANLSISSVGRRPHHWNVKLTASVKLLVGSGLLSRYQHWKFQVSPGMAGTAGVRGSAVRSMAIENSPAAPELRIWFA